MRAAELRRACASRAGEEGDADAAAAVLRQQHGLAEVEERRTDPSRAPERRLDVVLLVRRRQAGRAADGGPTPSNATTSPAPVQFRNWPDSCARSQGAIIQVRLVAKHRDAQPRQGWSCNRIASPTKNSVRIMPTCAFGAGRNHGSHDDAKGAGPRDAQSGDIQKTFIEALP